MLLGPVIVLMLWLAGVVVPKDYKFGLGMGLIIIFVVVLAAVIAYNDNKVDTENTKRT
jgi:hypothetical protein